MAALKLQKQKSTMFI